MGSREIPIECEHGVMVGSPPHGAYCERCDGTFLVCPVCGYAAHHRGAGCWWCGADEEEIARTEPWEELNDA